LKFTSSKTGELTSFDDYVSRMKKGQDQIYYLAGDSVETVKKSPLLEKLQKKGYEILYMLDPIDEYTMQNLHKYDSKYTLTNVAKEGLKVGDEKEEEEEKKDYEEEFKELTSYFTEKYPDKIGRVKISDRLLKSPCALVAESWGYTATMEKVIKAQALADPKQAKMWIGKKVLEINPKHPIMIELNNLIQADKDDVNARGISDLLLDTAAFSSGYAIEDPHNFAKNIHSILSRKLNVEELSDDILEPDETEDEETTAEKKEDEEEELEVEEEEDEKKTKKDKKAEKKHKKDFDVEDDSENKPHDKDEL